MESGEKLETGQYTNTLKSDREIMDYCIMREYYYHLDFKWTKDKSKEKYCWHIIYFYYSSIQRNTSSQPLHLYGKNDKPNIFFPFEWMNCCR